MERKESIQNIVENVLKYLGFAGSVEVTVEPEEQYLCKISIQDGQNFLIGQYGMNLAAFQHLIRIMARKQFGEKLDIVVDVNDYLFEKKALLEKEAAQALEEALQNNVSVALRPMLSYERKIIHAYLAKQESVITESVGSGDERKVMVRPKPIAEAI